MMTRIESARILCFFFFFNDTATTEIYTLSLHDALPISFAGPESFNSYSEWIRTIGEPAVPAQTTLWIIRLVLLADRKSTRLNSSHANISYAVFCLKKKNILIILHIHTLYCNPTSLFQFI